MRQVLAGWITREQHLLDQLRARPALPYAKWHKATQQVQSDKSRDRKLTAAGWQVESADYLDDAQIAALGTSWTKRLGSSRDALAVLALRGTLP